MSLDPFSSFLEKTSSMHGEVPKEFHSTWGRRVEKVHGHSLVEVLTDEGITGYGAAEAMWGWGAVHKAVAVMENMLKRVRPPL